MKASEVELPASTVPQDSVRVNVAQIQKLMEARVQDGFECLAKKYGEERVYEAIARRDSTIMAEMADVTGMADIEALLKSCLPKSFGWDPTQTTDTPEMGIGVLANEVAAESSRQKPKAVAYVDSPEAEEIDRLSGGATEQLVFPTGPILPEPGITYAAEVEFLGERRIVRVLVDEAFAERFSKRGELLDVPGGCIIRPDGSRIHLPKQGYPDSPPWTAPLTSPVSGTSLPVPLTQTSMLATAVSLHGTPQGLYYVATDKKIVEIKCFNPDDGDGSGNLKLQMSAEAFEEVPAPTGGMPSQVLRQGITVSGLTDDAVQKGVRFLQDKLGTVFEMLGNRREELLKEKRENDIEMQGLTGSEPGGVQSALSAEGDKINRALALVEIVIVPKGKHWSTMPQFAPIASHYDQEEIRSIDGGNVVFRVDEGSGEYRRLIFIPEGHDEVMIHEMFHWVEDCVLGDNQLAIIDREYSNAVMNKGSFARPYGVLRHEYFTTWVELFEGVGGLEGVRYLKENARPIYDLLCEVTGRGEESF